MSFDVVIGDEHMRPDNTPLTTSATALPRFSMRAIDPPSLRACEPSEPQRVPTLVGFLHLTSNKVGQLLRTKFGEFLPVHVEGRRLRNAQCLHIRHLLP